MRLSVITVNFNDCSGLERTLQSAAAQACRGEFEHIVVDGGSTDGSADLLQRSGGSALKWVSEKDGGIYEAMNKGVRMSSGDYLLFLNSGDVFFDGDSLASALPLLDGTDLVIGRLKFAGTGCLFPSGMDLTLGYFYTSSLPHGATFIKRDLLERRPYDESFKIVSDWKFFIQSLIFDNCTYKYIDVMVSVFESGGISSDRNACAAEKERALTEMFPPRILEDYLRFESGQGYHIGDYDRFFITARAFRSGRVIYSMSVLFERFLALFKKSARWSRNYPLKLKK